MSEQWVVTYEIKATYGGGRMMAEFYRGDRTECERIRAASLYGGEDDQHPTKHPWKAKAGPAKNWDEFVRDVVFITDDNDVARRR